MENKVVMIDIMFLCYWTIIKIIFIMKCARLEYMLVESDKIGYLQVGQVPPYSKNKKDIENNLQC